MNKLGAVGSNVGRTRGTSDYVGKYNRVKWYTDFLWYMEHNGFTVKVKRKDG